MLVNILCSEKYCARKETALVNCAQKRTLSTVLVYCAQKTALSNILGSEKYRGRKKTALGDCGFQYTAVSKILRFHTDLSKKMQRLLKYRAWKNTVLGPPRFPTVVRNGPCQLCLYTTLGKLRSVTYCARKNTVLGKKLRFSTALSNILRSVKYFACTLDLVKKYGAQ